MPRPPRNGPASAGSAGSAGAGAGESGASVSSPDPSSGDPSGSGPGPVRWPTPPATRTVRTTGPPPVTAASAATTGTAEARKPVAGAATAARTAVTPARTSRTASRYQRKPNPDRLPVMKPRTSGPAAPPRKWAVMSCVMAGLGVTVGNAREGLKAAADRVTKAWDEDGVACLIDDLIAEGSL